MDLPSNAPRLSKEHNYFEGSQALTVLQAAEGSVSEEFNGRHPDVLSNINT
jgi:hypothetical protein